MKRILVMLCVMLMAVAAVACSNSGNAAGPYGGSATSTPATLKPRSRYPTATRAGTAGARVW